MPHKKQGFRHIRLWKQFEQPLDCWAKSPPSLEHLPLFCTYLQPGALHPVPANAAAGLHWLLQTAEAPQSLTLK